jgi:hypothetical protein
LYLLSKVIEWFGYSNACRHRNPLLRLNKLKLQGDAMTRGQTTPTQPPGKPVDWPVIVCLSAGLPIELVFHDFRTFGVRSIGPRMVIALILMFLFAGFHPQDDGAPLGCFMVFTIIAGTVAFLVAKVKQRRGAMVHSRYNGRPYFMCVSPFSETTVKRIEPFIAFALGLIIDFANAPLGSFVMTASVLLALRVAFEHVGKTERALDINDALIEQGQAMENLRNQRMR